MVWDGDLYAGTLPPICALTGEATSGLQPVRFRTTPSWVVLLIFLGIVPFIVAWLLTQRVAGGVVPMSPRAMRRLHDRRRRAVLVFLAVPAVFIVAGLASAPFSATVPTVVSVVGFITTLAAIPACMMWYSAATLRGFVEEPNPWGRWVRLWNVDPTFAAAVQRMYEQRSQAFGRSPFPPTPGVPPPWRPAPPAAIS